MRSTQLLGAMAHAGLHAGEGFIALTGAMQLRTGAEGDPGRLPAAGFDLRRLDAGGGSGGDAWPAAGVARAARQLPDRLGFRFRRARHKASAVTYLPVSTRFSERPALSPRTRAGLLPRPWCCTWGLASPSSPVWQAGPLVFIDSPPRPGGCTVCLIHLRRHPAPSPRSSLPKPRPLRPSSPSPSPLPWLQRRSPSRP